MASTSISRTPSSTGNRQTWTFSAWVKRSQLSTDQKIFEASPDGSNTTDIRLKTDDTLQVYSEVGGVTKYNLKTNRKLRDTSAWYHVVIAVDTTQGTSSNRVKLYINGVQETSFSTATYPDQNFDTLVNFANQINVIGRRNPYSDFYFNGLISYAALVDGTQELPTIFGETDSVTGQWKIKTDITPSVAWGTNGFLILKNGNSLTDESTNSNNFTLGSGTLTNSLDCPSNVFATFNSLYKSNETLSYGNTRSVLATSDQFGGVSTIGVSSGKWYAEFKPNIAGSNYYGCGIIGDVNFSSNNNVGAGRDKSIGYRSGDGEKGVDNTFSSYGDTYTTNDIIGIALDLDSATNTITFYKNNVSQGTINITVPNPDGVWHFCACSMATGGSSDWSANFGNGYFGTTAVASAGTNASGNGIFEYDTPTGYTALSTKGLNL